MGIVWTFLSSILGAFGGLVLYIYYGRRGAFYRSEEAKYQMFRIDEKNRGDDA